MNDKLGLDELEELQLININAQIFEKAVKAGYALEPFIDTFMYSDTAKLLDSAEGYEKYRSAGAGALQVQALFGMTSLRSAVLRDGR